MHNGMRYNAVIFSSAIRFAHHLIRLTGYVLYSAVDAQHFLIERQMGVKLLLHPHWVLFNTEAI